MNASHFCPWNYLIVRTTTCATALILALTAQAQERRSATGVGDVYGHVLDAETGSYLSGVKVELVVPSDVKAPDKATGTTFASGYYSIRAPIGAVSSRFASERLLSLNLASVLMGGARHIDKFINASAFVVRVNKLGYKGFEAPLRVVGADPVKFNAWLECVELAPDSVPYASFAAGYDHVVRIEHVEVTPVVAPGAAVEVKVVATNVPLVGKDVPDLEVWIMGTLRFERLHGKTEGGITTYSGKVMTTEMRTDVGGLLTNATRKISPGLKCFEFSLDREKLPLSRRPSAVRVVAVGEADKLPDGVAALISESDSSLESHRDVGSSLKKIEALWPEANVPAIRDAIIARVDPSATGGVDEGNLFIKAVETIRAGTPAQGWSMISKAKSALPEIIVSSFEASIAAQSSPSDFKARATLARNVRALSTARLPHLVRLRDCLVAQPLAPLPEPQTASDGLYFASILIGKGDFDGALTALKIPTSDPSYASAAKAMSAECLQAKGDDTSALTLLDALMSVESGKELKAFYAHLTYATLLLKADRLDDAEAALVRALALARGSSEDYSAPSRLVSLGRTLYNEYSGPAISGTVGYAYPEAPAAQQLLFNFKALSNTEEPVAIRCLVARSLADLGAEFRAEKILGSLPAGDEYVLLSQAYVAKVLGKVALAKDFAARVHKANPKNVEAMTLLESIE